MAIVKKYLAKVISIKNSIEGIYTLEFESLDKPFKYSSGQFLHLAIDSDYDGSGQWPDSRCFSMQSNPDEKIIRITYAIKGNYTQLMKQRLSIGSKVWLKLPFGDLFSQPHSKENTVFIAGGTGITPFLSLFNSLLFATYSYPVLYAGFRSENLNLYCDELKLAKDINSQFKIIAVYQDLEGTLNIEKIYKASSLNSTFFISGPPVMIRSFKQKLIENNVLQSNILTDDWE